MTTNSTDLTSGGSSDGAFSAQPTTADQRLLASWDANAAAWTTAVREQRIPSRRAGTDAAIVQACLRTIAATVLDVGCGEGWLARALTRRLAPQGRVLIQTVHPWLAMGEGSYANTWREENFQGFGVAFPSAMPWYFRTLGSWIEELTAAGLSLLTVNEPVHPETGRPLSLVLECALSA